MAHAIHHRTDDRSLHVAYWTLAICLAAVALAFFVSYTGTATMVADSGSTMSPLIW